MFLQKGCGNLTLKVYRDASCSQKSFCHQHFLEFLSFEMI